MKKLVLTKKEKIVAIVILFWSFVTLSNYLTNFDMRGDAMLFESPWSNIMQFFEFYMGKSGDGTDNFDVSELMVYGVLPWLVFFTYLFLKKKEQ